MENIEITLDNINVSNVSDVENVDVKLDNINVSNCKYNCIDKCMLVGLMVLK